MVGNVVEDICKPGLRIDVVEAAGLCRTANYAEHRWKTASTPANPLRKGVCANRPGVLIDG